MPKSWKAEVQTYECKPDAWTANALRFSTEALATAYASDLYRRWTSVERYRAVESDDPVNTNDKGEYVT